MLVTLWFIDKLVRMVSVAEKAPLLKVGEVAQRLHVSPAKAYRLVASGELPAYRIGGSWRVDPERFEAWLEERAA